MRVVIVANKLSETDPATGQHYVLGKDDVATVPEAFGKHLCDRGWARDEAGEYTSAPFTPGAVRLDVQSLRVTPKPETT